MARNPLLKFKTEILNSVIYPKLTKILHDHGNINIEELHIKFRETYDCTVSQREFKEWCNDMHLKCEIITAWNLVPANQIPPTHREENSNDLNNMWIDIPPPTDPEITFDNE
tara:strand:+ start:2412 stop:2747 length:336 start_codon:yes stop_codon:yes gene_type:complete